ncbi:MAG TPA: hypothetical protein PK969_02765 [Treponemataceae bacterium]|nr:hypothetical protein [Treponemataceae bacterium]
MKRTIWIFLLAAFACIPMWSMEFVLAAQSSNFAFNASGEFTPEKIKTGSSFQITDRIQSNLDGKIVFDSDPVCGNLLSARASYKTSYLEISAGPAFGILNSGSDTSDIAFLVQPGLGIGFSIIAPGILVATADTDFALPPPSQNSGQVYLQKSTISVGFYLPNILCSVAVSQRTNSATGTDNTIKSLTDYGFYTEAFKKGSAFRVGIDFVYRVCDYYATAGSDANRKIGNLVLGGAVTWVPKDDLNFFIDGNGALYSFSLDESVPDLDKFMFDLKMGVKIKTGGKNLR